MHATVKRLVRRAIPIEILNSTRDTFAWPIRRRRRLRFAMLYLAPQLKLAHSWANSRSESSNFMYGLTPLNRRDLAHLLALLFARPTSEIYRLFDEALGDVALHQHIQKSLKPYLPGATDFQIGRRLGWYTVARLIKPRLIVETGVDFGLGACVLSAALLRNAAEGSPGRYLGTEQRSTAGQIYTAPYTSVGRIAYGDSLETLHTITDPIDLFINDSDHSFDYEAREYECIASRLSPDAVILGDNSHASPSLMDFSEHNERRYVFFKEEPLNHWYPGAGIGISLPSRR